MKPGKRFFVRPPENALSSRNKQPTEGGTTMSSDPAWPTFRP